MHTFGLCRHDTTMQLVPFKEARSRSNISSALHNLKSDVSKRPPSRPYIYFFVVVVVVVVDDGDAPSPTQRAFLPFLLHLFLYAPPPPPAHCAKCWDRDRERPHGRRTRPPTAHAGPSVLLPSLTRSHCRFVSCVLRANERGPKMMAAAPTSEQK